MKPTSLTTRRQLLSRSIVSLAAAMVARPVLSADEPKPTVTKLSADAFDKARKDKDVVVIDVRTPEEFAAGRIPGAINIPVTGAGAESFDAKVAQAAKGKTPYIYCRSGRRTLTAIEKMQALGIKSIVELEGSWLAWTAASKEVEKGAAPAK